MVDITCITGSANEVQETALIKSMYEVIAVNTKSVKIRKVVNRRER